MNIKKYILPALLVFCGATLLWSAAPTDNKAKKAEMIYLEAVDADADGRTDDAFMLLRHAHRIDPGDPYIAGTLAEFMIALPTADSLVREQAYTDIRNRFLANPNDERNAALLAHVAKSLSRIDDVIMVWETLDSLLPARTDPAMNLSESLLMRYALRLDRADFDRSMAIYDRLEKGTGLTPEITVRRLQAYMLHHDDSAMLAEVKRLADSAPGDFENMLYAAGFAAGIKQNELALSYLKTAEEIKPDNGQVSLVRAQLYQTMNDSVNYDAEVFRCLQSPTVEYGVKFELLQGYVVKLYTDSLQRPRIEQMFETMQEQNPGEASLHSLYGMYKASTGQPEAAIEQFSYSADLEPTNHETWERMIALYGDKNDAENIIKLSRKALHYFPADTYFIMMGVTGMRIENRNDEALALLDSLDMTTINKPELLSNIYTHRGDLLYTKKDRKGAIEAYERAIEHDASNYMALNNCAYFMLEGEDADLDRAELYSSIATAAEPENATYLDTYAWVFFHKKNYEKAREEIDKAIEALEKDTADNPEAVAGHADVYDHAGDIYFFCGDTNKAVDFWKKALKLAPDQMLIARKIKARHYIDM